MPNAPQTFESKLFDFYKEAYIAELENKEKFNARLTFNLAILTILANICVSFLNDAPAYRSIWMVISFYATFGVAVLLGLISIFFFFRALGFPFGHPYAYVARTTEIEKYLQDVKEYNQRVPDKDKLDLEQAFHGNLMSQYAKLADVNALSNRKKMDSLTKTLVFSVLSLIFLLLSAPLFFSIKFSGSKPPQKIEITSPIRIEERKPDPQP